MRWGPNVFHGLEPPVQGSVSQRVHWRKLKVHRAANCTQCQVWKLAGTHFSFQLVFVACSGTARRYHAQAPPSLTLISNWHHPKLHASWMWNSLARLWLLRGPAACVLARTHIFSFGPPILLPNPPQQFTSSHKAGHWTDDGQNKRHIQPRTHHPASGKAQQLRVGPWQNNGCKKNSLRHTPTTSDILLKSDQI